MPCDKGLTGPYVGVAPGAAVMVTSLQGKVLGTGHLQAGTLSMHGVLYPFTVGGLPSVEKYVVKVATVASGTYTKSTLDNDSWVIEISVGDKAM